MYSCKLQPEVRILPLVGEFVVNNLQRVCTCREDTMYLSVQCHSSFHYRYKGIGLSISSASRIHSYQSNILVHFCFCDFESRVIILTVFCLRLGVAFRETIFSLTVEKEIVRKLKKKHSNPRW